MRYFNVYGPGMNPTGDYALVVPRFIAACVRGARPVIEGDGEQSRDFTYIDDVVDANILAARAPDDALGLAYNIGGGGKPTSIGQLLAMVAREVGVEPDPVLRAASAGDIRMTMADVTLATRPVGLPPDGRHRGRHPAHRRLVPGGGRVRVAVIGTGHVGLITAVGLASLGNEVVGMDMATEKVERLTRGETPFHEPDLDRLHRSGLGTGDLRFTTSIEDAVAGARVVFICVGRPTDGTGDRSLFAVEEAARAIARNAERGTVLAVKSTVPPGTTGRIDRVVRLESPRG